MLPSPALDCLGSRLPASLHACLRGYVPGCLPAGLLLACGLACLPDCLLARRLTARLSVFLFACLPHFSHRRILQVYVQTTLNVLIEINPQIRIPRTFKRFSGLMGEGRTSKRSSSVLWHFFPPFFFSKILLTRRLCFLFGRVGGCLALLSIRKCVTHGWRTVLSSHVPRGVCRFLPDLESVRFSIWRCLFSMGLYSSWFLVPSTAVSSVAEIELEVEEAHDVRRERGKRGAGAARMA